MWKFTASSRYLQQAADDSPLCHITLGILLFIILSSKFSSSRFVSSGFAYSGPLPKSRTHQRQSSLYITVFFTVMFSSCPQQSHWGHLAKSGMFFGCQDSGKVVPLASVRQRPEILLRHYSAQNNCLTTLTQQRNIWSKISTVLRLRNLSLNRNSFGWIRKNLGDWIWREVLTLLGNDWSVYNYVNKPPELF